MINVWWVTHLLNAEDGPWNMVVRLRRLVGNGFWGNLLDCFYCLSIWVAASIAWLLGGTWGERLLLWPALSGGAILLERVTTRRELPPVERRFEDLEESDELLRRKESPVDRKSATAAGPRPADPAF